MTTQRYERIPVFTPGDRMKKARDMAGLSQDEMAAVTGISRGTVSHLELDKAPLKVSYLKLWAMATGVPVEWLEHGAGESGPGPGSGLPADEKAERLAQLAASKRPRHAGGTTARYDRAA